MRSKKNTKTICKKFIALIQLRDAIQLYYKKTYISAITLSSAAEEIFGKLTDEKYSKIIGTPVKRNYADENAFLIAHFNPFHENKYSLLSEEDQEKYCNEIQKQYIADRNKIRNQLKHRDAGEDEVEFSNFRLIAENHIAGAIINYQLFENKLPEDEIIKKYCKEKGIN